MEDIEAHIYALIPLQNGRPSRVIAWFESRVAAVRHARGAKIGRYAVAPVEFYAEHPAPERDQESVALHPSYQVEGILAATARLQAENLLDRDTEYDEEKGDRPPLLPADYRRALYGLLALEPPRLEHASQGAVTPCEAEAYRLGCAAMIDLMHIAIGEAWLPNRLDGRSSPFQSPDA
jgi:hypothetical protein